MQSKNLSYIPILKMLIANIGFSARWLLKVLRERFARKWFSSIPKIIAKTEPDIARYVTSIRDRLTCRAWANMRASIRDAGWHCATSSGVGTIPSVAACQQYSIDPSLAASTNDAYICGIKNARRFWSPSCFVALTGAKLEALWDAMTTGAASPQGTRRRI